MKDGCMVAIPYSLGQSFQHPKPKKEAIPVDEVAIPYSLGQSFQLKLNEARETGDKEASQSLIH